MREKTVDGHEIFQPDETPLVPPQKRAPLTAQTRQLADQPVIRERDAEIFIGWELKQCRTQNASRTQVSMTFIQERYSGVAKNI
jgi:hypothetical protein